MEQEPFWGRTSSELSVPTEELKGYVTLVGEKWSREHKCAATVQLHVVEELWNMFEDSEMNSWKESDGDSQVEEELLSISKEAVHGDENARTFRLQCTVQNIVVVMLIDSSSSSCFISEELARRLKGVQLSIKPVRVRVANGEVLDCATELPFCQWEVQGHVFHTTFRVLPLSYYDLILGIDWLEQHSPMIIH